MGDGAVGCRFTIQARLRVAVFIVTSNTRQGRHHHPKGLNQPPPAQRNARLLFNMENEKKEKTRPGSGGV
jgi:hypothetical protein